MALIVLIWGMLPPHVMETGQLDPRDWLLPGVVGLVLLMALLRWCLGAWRWPMGICAMLAVSAPPLALCVAGSAGQPGRLAAWLHPAPLRFPPAHKRSIVGIVSGPVLHGPVRGGVLQAGFARAPLWRLLSERFALRPMDSVDARAAEGLDALLLIQPRALAPEELVALDKWVRMGGKAILLVDPDLRWADERPLGHALRPPPVSLLGPLLAHWGVELAPSGPRYGGDPVERRFLDDGQMLQIAGASHFLPDNPLCRLSSAGLVARCRIGRGTAILVADADFANDALWTADPADPGNMRRWTSDAPAILADFLGSHGENIGGRRIWLTRADGLPAALRPALALVAILGLIVFASAARRGTKDEKEGHSQKP